MAPSDLQKAANRMAFGEAEKEVGEHMGSTMGMGMIGGATGKLKLAHKDFKSIHLLAPLESSLSNQTHLSHFLF